MKNITNKQASKNRKEIIITGTIVARGIQAILLLCLFYGLVQTMVFGQEIDTLLLLMMGSSLVTLELALCKEKEPENGHEN